MGSERSIGDGRNVWKGLSEKKKDNTKDMVCTPGFIWGQIGKEAYKRRATEGGEVLGEET